MRCTDARITKHAASMISNAPNTGGWCSEYTKTTDATTATAAEDEADGDDDDCGGGHDCDDSGGGNDSDQSQLRDIH